MSQIGVVMKAALKTNLSMRSVIIVSIGVAVICAGGVATIFATQFIGPEMRAPVPDRSRLENFLGLILFTTSFISIGIFSSVSAIQSLAREKARGNIQALLATPLAPRDIWLGKSVGVFLPGLVFAVVMTTAALIALNFIYFVPKIGFLITAEMLVSNLVAVPLVYLALTALVHEVGLVGKPATANIIAQVFLPVMITIMINLALRGVMNAGSWLFTITLVGLAIVISIFVIKLRSSLSVERIILSQ